MAFTATFYELAKRVNSTKRPGVGTPVLSTTIILKEGCSAQAPVVGIKWDGSTNPSRYNMAHISTFGRYYWVTDWTYNDRIWWASCRCDVLATAKTEIGNATKYVLRAASDYDPNVTDRKYMPIMPCRVQNHSVTGFSWPSTFDQGRFVVGIIGQGNTFNVAGTGYMVLNANQLQDLYNAVFTESVGIWTGTTTPASVEEAIVKFGENITKSVAEPAQFINSICWVPFTPSSDAPSEIKLGMIRTQVFARPLLNPIHTDYFSVNIPWNDNGADPWMYLAPFAQYRLHIPPFPDVQLDAAKIYGKTVSGAIYTDVTTGLAHMDVGVTGASSFITVGGSVGVQLSFSGNNVDYFGALKSAISTASSVTAAGLAGDVSGAIAGGLSGIGSVVEAAMPVSTQGGYSGGIGAIRAPKILTRTLYTVPDKDDTEQGRPLCQLKQLSTLSGYILCADGDIPAALTDGELREIERYLTGGFFYE